MTDLLSLIEERPTPSIDRSLPMEKRFANWVERNPELIAFVTRRALAAARNGARRLSAKALVEEARSSRIVTVDGRRDFAVDNSFTAPLARLLMQREPELIGLFEIRKRRGE